MSTHGPMAVTPSSGAANTSVIVVAAIPAGTNVIGHVIADSGSTTAVTGNVAVVQPTGTNLHAVLDTGSTTAVTQATGTNLHTVVDSGTVTTVSTVTAVTTVSACRNVGNTGATLDAAIGGAASTNALWTEHAPATASAGSCTTGVAASLTVLNIKASAGNVYGVTVVNKTSSVIYLQFYNTAGTPTLGTSVISWIPIAASAVLIIPPGSYALANYATGIGIGASTTPTSTGTPATAPDVTVWFK